MIFSANEWGPQEWVAILGAIGTVIGCTWRLSATLNSRFTSLETAVKANGDSIVRIHAMVEDHAEDCDDDRKKIGNTLDNHEHRIGGLEAVQG